MTKALFHLRQFRLLLLVLLCALFSLPLSAQEAYVVEDGTTLTFYCDNHLSWKPGKTCGLYDISYSSRERTQRVVFDSSFKNYRPTSTARWFSGFKSLYDIKGLENLNTSEVTNMSKMFNDCSNLRSSSLNVSNFNTSKVTDMSAMFSGCSGLTSLNLSNFNTSAVTNMSQMFKGCSKLTSLNLSNFNTSKVTDMSEMFWGCSGLKELNVSNFNTSKVTNMVWMFSDCSGLTSLNVSNFNTSAVIGMSCMFYGCSGLKELNISNFNTSAVIGMSRMFNGCSGLKELNVSNFNTSAVKYMSEMFEDCSGLKELNISNFNTSAVIGMSRMFYGCSGLTELNVSNFNTSAVTDMREMFRDCSGLRTILNPNTWRCKQSQDMFYGCTQLKGAVKYDGRKEDATMANPETGYFTDSIPRAYVEQSEDQQTLTFYYDINRAFRSGETWGINEKYNSSFPAWTETSSSPTKVVTKVVFDASFKNFRPTTTQCWFYYLNALTTIEGFENLNTSEVTNMYEMFSDCSKLTSLNLSNFNTSAVTDMSAMFFRCSGLTSLNVSNFNTSAVTNMGSMFSGCSGLKTILNTNTWRCDHSNYMFNGCTQLKGAVKYDGNKLDATMANPTTGYFTDPTPKAYVSQSEDQHTLTFYYDNNRKLRSDKTWDIDEKNNWSRPVWAGTYSAANKAVTKVVFDASFKDFRPTTTEGWFYNLSALTTIEGLKNLNTSAVTNMGYMFYGCYGLTSLNLSNFNTSAVTNMGYMFWGCSGLKELNLSNFNTAKVTNMGWMFAYCSGLTSLNVSNFNTSAVTDMSVMFLYCSGLTSLNVSNFNTSAVTNMNGMFYGCSDLKELNLSNFNTSAVTNMGQMFYGCSGLKELNVSNFNTARVTNMDVMFKNCSGLKTILNTNTWRCENSQDMFKGCTQLNGAVKYDESKVDATMANPTTGYFTDPNKKHLEAYVQQSEDKHTLTFFYDVNRTLRSGKTWDIDEQQNASEDGTEKIPAWASLNPNLETTKVVFDASFRNFLPTTTKAWFSSLQNLSTIEGIENLNTSAVTDMSGMFIGCSSLKELNVSNFNTSKVTDMRAMFANCSGLKELNLFSFNTSAVKSMWGMFLGCSSLTSLNLSNFNTSAVRDMSGMFSYCSSLKTIINTNTWRCEESQDMFKGCAQLNGAVKYDASKLDDTMANPTTGYFTDPNRKLEAYVLQSEDQHTLTFYYDNNRKLRSGKTWDIDEKSSSSKPVWAGTYSTANKAVTKVVFDASFKDFRPTTTEGWFYHLSELATIEGLENLNTSAVTDMSAMFFRCSGLTSLNLSNFNTSKVTNMGWMFYNCYGLTSLNVSNLNTSAVTNMRGMFYGCSRLTSLNISNFNTSKVTNMSEMFEGCSGLKELNVSNFNTSAVTNMGGMFRDCSGLTSLNLSNFNTSAVTDMYEMFRDCSGLKTILNPNTWLCDNSQNMFYGCTLLNGAVNYDASKVDVTMANPTTGYFTDPNREYPKAYVLQSEDQHTLTFYYDNNRKLRSGKTWGIDEKSSSSKPVWAGTYSTANKAVTKVVFDASFKVFRPTTTEGWFYHLSELATIEGLENLNTSAVKDMSAMFFRCSGLTSLNLSNFNTSKVTHMGWMFEGCSKLTSLNLSNFNTSAVTNMIAMFSRCPGLKELNISSFNTSAVKNMSWMFCDCSGLKELNISNFNTSSVTNMSQMFFGSSGLTALNLSNFNTSAVTNMSWMFKNCSGLKELNLSNFNTSAVAYMYEMFRDCSGLKTILNPNTWRFEESHDMFKGCTQLKGAVKYDGSKVDATMANPTTGYFSQKLPSAIGRVVFEDNNATQIYNLQGKRVNANLRHLPAGFYIVNGKKVYLNEKP